MPTDNPKISAYVPQAVYNRFKQFQEERGLSMSQAATLLFAEYFGVNFKEEITAEFTSGLKERVESLQNQLDEIKQELSTFKSEYHEFIDRVEEVWLARELQRVISENNTASPVLATSHSELKSESNSELLENLSEDSLNQKSELNSELHSEVLETISNSEMLTEPLNQSNELQSELSSKPNDELLTTQQSSFNGSLFSEPPLSEELKINHETLSLRIGMKLGSLRNVRSEKSTDEFVQWSSGKDPDKIGWMPFKEGRKTYYSPSGELQSETRSRLLVWISENQF